MRWVFLAVAFLVAGCGVDDAGEDFVTCGKVHPCRTLEFVVHDTTTSTVNDTNRTLSGMQTDIRLRVSAPVFGYVVLERVGFDVSAKAIEWPSDALEVVFEDFTLVLGENVLRASLWTRDGEEFARVELNVTVIE